LARRCAKRPPGGAGGGEQGAAFGLQSLGGLAAAIGALVDPAGDGGAGGFAGEMRSLGGALGVCDCGQEAAGAGGAPGLKSTEAGAGGGLDLRLAPRLPRLRPETRPSHPPTAAHLLGMRFSPRVLASPLLGDEGREMWRIPHVRSV